MFVPANPPTVAVDFSAAPVYFAAIGDDEVKVVELEVEVFKHLLAVHLPQHCNLTKRSIVHRVIFLFAKFGLNLYLFVHFTLCRHPIVNT